MRLLIVITAILTTGIALFGYVNNFKMHENLVWRLTHDKKIIKESGEVDKYEYYESFSCTETEGDCSNAYWMFKVTGIKKCILVDVVVKEDFPFYSVVSVVPSHHLESLYTEDGVVYENKRVVSECPNT